MSPTVDISSIKQQLKTDDPIFILFGNNATVDHVGASLALFLALKEAKKDVTIASPIELRTEFSRLVGLNHISKTIGNRNLVISFTQYDPGSIEKISHNDGAGNTFELIIQPKPGKKAPSPKNIDFSFKGAQAGLIFTLGISRLEDLGKIYESDRKIFSEATTVAFNRRQSPNFASTSILDNSAGSYAEILLEFLSQIELDFPQDAASNLLAGLDFATNRFQNPLISADAFIAAGKLLQKGAKRQPPPITSAASQFPGFQPPAFPPFNVPGQMNLPTPASSQAKQPKNPSPQNQPTPSQSTQPNLPTLPLPLPKPSQENKKNEQKQDSKNPPKEWLEPKIYKGSSRV